MPPSINHEDFNNINNRLVTDTRSKTNLIISGDFLPVLLNGDAKEGIVGQNLTRRFFSLDQLVRCSSSHQCPGIHKATITPQYIGGTKQLPNCENNVRKQDVHIKRYVYQICYDILLLISIRLQFN